LDNVCNDRNGHIASPLGLPGNRPDPWGFLGDLGSILGVFAIGVAPAGPVPRNVADHYLAWLGSGAHGSLDYAARNLAERRDPGQPRIQPRAAAVVSLALPYGGGALNEGIWRHVAAHARGADYHPTVRRVLETVYRAVRTVFPGARGRCLVDTAPVMERWWAVACGLGFIGRHGGLVVPGRGTRVVLGELIVAGVLAPAAGPMAGRFSGCGDCRACIDACPTGALNKAGLVDCRLCLSFHSGENTAGTIPPEVAREMTSLFGCDLCTSACPLEADDTCALDPPPVPGPRDLDPASLLEMPGAGLARLIGDTALERAGVAAIRRNARLVCERHRGCRPAGSVK